MALFRLDGSRFLQVNIRWKALDEIYKIYMLLRRSGHNILAKNRRTFWWFFRNIEHFHFVENLFRKYCHQNLAQFWSTFVGKFPGNGNLNPPPCSFRFFFERISPARWGPPGMGALRHGPPEMSFLRKRNEKVKEQKDPCLDAKMSQISLRCKKCRKYQLAWV